MDVAISLPDGSSSQISFSTLLGQATYTVLYFYPKDNTSGCTLEAQEFTALHKQFSDLDAQIVGVSKDSHKSHCGFMEKHSLSFPLISDPEWLLHNQFGAVGEKSMYGKKYMGTIRSTYILDNQGTILHQRTNVKARGHAQEVLDILSSLVSASS